LLEENKLLKTDKGELDKLLMYARFELDFERIYRDIFGSQMALLSMLYNQTTGLTQEAISAFYEQVKGRFSVYETNSWDWRRYLSFLVSHKLIDEDYVGHFIITPKGRAFLGFIEKYNYRSKDL